MNEYFGQEKSSFKCDRVEQCVTVRAVVVFMELANGIVNNCQYFSEISSQYSEFLWSSG